LQETDDAQQKSPAAKTDTAPTPAKPASTDADSHAAAAQNEPAKADGQAKADPAKVETHPRPQGPRVGPGHRPPVPEWSKAPPTPSLREVTVKPSLRPPAPGPTKTPPMLNPREATVNASLRAPHLALMELQVRPPMMARPPLRPPEQAPTVRRIPDG